MPLAFPAVEDIHLANAPLREVICQVRFPTILRIANEEPGDFQERIRARFPVLSVDREVLIQTDSAKPDGPVQVRAAIFRFHNQDRKRSVSLAHNFYALSVKDYQHWPDFAGDLAYVADAAQDVYAIPYGTRVGLRYINVLRPDLTESGDFKAVLSVLRDELTVMLRTSVIESPDQTMHQIQVTDNDDRFTFRYGLVREGTPPEPRFLLDFDQYAEGDIELSNLLDRCERYHQDIYRAFRWCIAEGELELFRARPVTEEEERDERINDT